MNINSIPRYQKERIIHTIIIAEVDNKHQVLIKTTEAPPPHQNSKLGQRRVDGTQTKGAFRGLRDAHGRGAPAEEGDVWGDGWG